MSKDVTQRLGDVATVIAGQSPDGKAYNSDGCGMAFFQGKKEFGEKFIGEPTTWTTEVTRIAQPGDVLMSVRAPVGPVNFATQECCIGRGLAAIRAGSKLDHEYLYYCLLSQRHKIEGTEGAVFASINKAQIEAIELPVPTLPEQRRIVGILDEAFAAIAIAKSNTEQNLVNARAVFENAVDKVFSGLTQSVKGRPLADCVEDISTGPFGSLIHKSDYREGGIPLVNPINIDGDEIIPDPRKAVSKETAKTLARYALHKGDVVTARRGEIGRCAVVTDEQAGWLCGTGSFFIRPGATVDSYFLTHLLRSTPYRSQLERVSARATMPSIGNDDLCQLLVHIPPLTEQKTIELRLDGLADEVAKLKDVVIRKLAALDALKASLLHHAFTGQLTDSNIERAVATA
ncbi:MAG: restriction endonuclease subunit S [Planctomycetota bacterium]|nr:restriction endonuclease subunit S [Planctomycetota bacterium]